MQFVECLKGGINVKRRLACGRRSLEGVIGVLRDRRPEISRTERERIRDWHLIDHQLIFEVINEFSHIILSIFVGLIVDEFAQKLILVLNLKKTNFESCQVSHGLQVGQKGSNVPLRVRHGC